MTVGKRSAVHRVGKVLYCQMFDVSRAYTSTGGVSFRNEILRVGRVTTRAEDAQGTPTQSHISPRLLAYEDSHGPWLSELALGMKTGPPWVFSVLSFKERKFFLS